MCSNCTRETHRLLNPFAYCNIILITVVINKLLNPPLLNPPLWTPENDQKAPSAASVNVRLPCLRRDLRAGSISRDVANFPSELCKRRSGTFAEVARSVRPNGVGLPYHNHISYTISIYDYSIPAYIIIYIYIYIRLLIIREGSEQGWLASSPLREAANKTSVIYMYV